MGDPASPERPKGEREKLPEVKLQNLLDSYVKEYAGVMKGIEEREEEIEKTRKGLKSVAPSKMKGAPAKTPLTSEEKMVEALIKAREKLDPIREQIRNLIQQHPKERKALVDTLSTALEKAFITDLVLLAELHDIKRRQEMNEWINTWAKDKPQEDVMASFNAIKKNEKPRRLAYASGVEFPDMPQEIVLKSFFIEELADPKSALRPIILEFKKNKNINEMTAKIFEFFKKFVTRKNLNIEPFCAENKEMFQLLCVVAGVQSDTYWQDIYQMSPVSQFDSKGQIALENFDPTKPDMRYFPIAGLIPRGLNTAADFLGKHLKPDMNDLTRWTASSMLLGAVQLGGAMTFLLNVGGAVFGQVWQGGKMFGSLSRLDFKQALHHIPLIGKDARKALVSSLPTGRIIAAGVGLLVSKGIVDPERWDRWIQGGMVRGGMIDRAALMAASPSETGRRFLQWCGDKFSIENAKNLMVDYLWDPAVGAATWIGTGAENNWTEFIEWSKKLPFVNGYFKFGEYREHFKVLNLARDFVSDELKKKDQPLANKLSPGTRQGFEQFLTGYLKAAETEKSYPKLSLEDFVIAGFLKADDIKDKADRAKKVFDVQKELGEKLLEQARWVKNQRAL